MLVIIPVSVLDALIFWWIFFSLHHTMKVLSLRQNVVKLTLYKRFQFILAVAVISTIAFTGWDLTIKSAIPSTDPAAAEQEWRNEWFREWAFWHLLFCGQCDTPLPQSFFLWFWIFLCQLERALIRCLPSPTIS